MYKKLLLTKNQYKFISIICASIVPLLVTGPFLPDLTISILVIWFLIFSIKNKIYKIYINIYFYIFVIFCLICILSSLLSDNILFSLKTSLFYFRIGVFSMLILFLIDQNKKILDFFYYSLFITFLIIVIDGYIQYLSGQNIFGLAIKDYRVSSFFGNQLILGSYLSRLFPLFFALFVIRKKKKQIEIYFISILFIGIDVLIFLSGERTAFFLLNLSTIFIILFIREYKLFRLSIFILSIIVITLITFGDEKIKNRYIKAPIESIGINSLSGKKYFFSPTHDSFFRTSWNMFLDKPFLGHGPKMFRIKCSNEIFAEGKKPCSTHPHNFYVQLLAETGIAGFLFLFGVFIYIIFLICSHIKIFLINRKYFLSDFQICLLAGLLITVWPIITSGSFFNNYLMILYSLQIGFFPKKKFFLIEEKINQKINLKKQQNN